MLVCLHLFTAPMVQFSSSCTRLTVKLKIHDDIFGFKVTQNQPETHLETKTGTLEQQAEWTEGHSEGSFS